MARTGRRPRYPRTPGATTTSTSSPARTAPTISSLTAPTARKAATAPTRTSRAGINEHGRSKLAGWMTRAIAMSSLPLGREPSVALADTPGAGRGNGLSRQPGLSLLELLIVLMLMAIIASVVIPIFGPGVSTTELKRAARELAAGLRLARSQAISQRTEAVLEIDVATRAFRVPPDPKVHTM